MNNLENDLTMSAHYWTTCCVCGKDAVGCGLIIDEPQLSLDRKVNTNKLQSALYFNSRGHRMHPACIERLKQYFDLRERNETTNASRRPILSLKK